MRTVRPFLATVTLLLLIATVTLSATATTPSGVQGTVRISGTATPVAGAIVRFVRAGSTSVVERRTDRDGRFSYTVAPGTYRLTVVCDGFELFEIPEIEVRSSENIKLVLPLVRAL